MELNLTYTQPQIDVFIASKAKRRVLAKGRRLGFTQGAAQYVVESMLSKRYPKILWGDTINKNIRKYYELYFEPILRKLPKTLWEWRVTDKSLRVNGCTCDFYAAENPKNWEGFGYDLAILNEAGIILEDRYLWENAVSPMLLDNPNAVCIIGGTPKGKNLFTDLWQTAKSNELEGWQPFKYSTYDNPYLTRASVDELVAQLGGRDCDLVKQEIFGDFVDIAYYDLLSRELIDAALNHIGEPPANNGYCEVWGLDIARQGPDNSALAKRRDDYIYELKSFHIPNLMDVADIVAAEYQRTYRKPDAIFAEINGMGWGCYDRMHRLGLPVLGADVSKNATQPKIANKRSEMYQKLKSFLEQGGKLPRTPNPRLKEGLRGIRYIIGEDSVFRLIPKTDIKDKLGFSPDEADACALTFFAPVEPKLNELELELLNQPLETGAW
jgi:hypothetical protein